MKLHLEAAHIYPFCMSRHLNQLDPAYDVWGILRIFWTQEKIAAWQARLCTTKKTEFLENLIMMNKTAHSAWDKSHFALKPLPNECSDSMMKVEFHWLRVRKHTSTVFLTEEPDLPAHLPHGEGNVKFWNCTTEQKVCSGDVITMTTKNSTTHPLPSLELLTMLWNLNRVAALSGSAEALEAVLDDDSDGDDNWGLPVDEYSGYASGWTNSSNGGDDSDSSPTEEDDVKPT